MAHLTTLSDYVNSYNSDPILSSDELAWASDIRPLDNLLLFLADYIEQERAAGRGGCSVESEEREIYDRAVSLGVASMPQPDDPPSVVPSSYLTPIQLQQISLENQALIDLKQRRIRQLSQNIARLDSIKKSSQQFQASREDQERRLEDRIFEVESSLAALSEQISQSAPGLESRLSVALQSKSSSSPPIDSSNDSHPSLIQLQSLLSTLQRHSTLQQSPSACAHPDLAEERQLLESEAFRLVPKLEGPARSVAWEEELERLIDAEDFSDEGDEVDRTMEGGTSLVHEVLKAGWEMDREEEMSGRLGALRKTELGLRTRLVPSALLLYALAKEEYEHRESLSDMTIALREETELLAGQKREEGSGLHGLSRGREIGVGLPKLSISKAALAARLSASSTEPILTDADYVEAFSSLRTEVDQLTSSTDSRHSAQRHQHAAIERANLSGDPFLDLSSSKTLFPLLTLLNTYRPTPSHPFLPTPPAVAEAEAALKAQVATAEKLVKEWASVGGGRKLSEEELEREKRRVERFVKENSTLGRTGV